MQLQKLIKGIEYKGILDNRDITSITYDSRKVKRGTLFVAISGYKVDGHDYILEAIENGASAILANGRSPIIKTVPIIQVKNPRLALSQISAQFYGNPSKSMQIIGITGTNGKTSITSIIHHIMQHSGLSCGAMGTLGFKTPTGIMSTGFTTPESVEVHQMLHTLKMAEVNNVIMEISSHALELHRVKDVDINIAVFSNLTPEHLDFHGNMENYFLSKIKLFNNLESNKTAIINADDPYAKRICKNTKAKIITYGKNKSADLYSSKTKLTINGIESYLNFKDTSIKIQSHLIGEYNLSNIMAAVAVCLSLGISNADIENAINNLHSIPGRMELVKCNVPGKVYIDYAHSPDAYEKLFSNIIKLNNNYKIITVFGCGGQRDTSKRNKMAQISEKFSDYCYITTDNPRNESINNIIKDITNGFSGSNYEIIEDRKDAIETALKKMDENSILLVLGKGRENYQEINSIKLPYSDLNIIQEFYIEN